MSVDAGKATSAKKPKKSEAEKKRWGKLKAILESTIITAAILGSSGYFWNTYTSFRSNMIVKYEHLIKNIETYIFIDEDLYVFCEEKKRVSKNCSCLYGIEVLKYRKTLIGQFEKVIDNLRTLGKFLPHYHYYQIRELVYWNNELLSSEKGICGAELLVPPKEMDKWKDLILGNLMKEKLKYTGRSYALKAYFEDLFTYKGSELYSKENVDLSKLPIYYHP